MRSILIYIFTNQCVSGVKSATLHVHVDLTCLSPCLSLSLSLRLSLTLSRSPPSQYTLGGVTMYTGRSWAKYAFFASALAHTDARESIVKRDAMIPSGTMVGSYASRFVTLPSPAEASAPLTSDRVPASPVVTTAVVRPKTSEADPLPVVFIMRLLSESPSEAKTSDAPSVIR